jgi:hypothetical protein
MRTLSPNGSFNMKINSPEYYNALEDYNFNFKNGYIFKKENIFKEFVDDLYELRMSYHKTDPMNMIAKLLMNSLYGRFAMKPIKNIQGFFSKDEFFKIGKEFSIIDYIDFLDKDNKCSIFVNYENPNILDNDTKVSISIASAVTAYSRVKMSEYKKGGYNLYYTDTDSGL